MNTSVAASYIRQGIAIIGVLLCALVPSVSPQVVLTGTISNGDVVCPGMTATFTCQTTGSGIIAWTSDDYIGQGARLQFAAFNNLDEIRVSPISSDTIATFISKTDPGVTPVLVSQLNITVSSTFPNPSITCVHVGNNMRDTISFQSLADPETPEVKTFEQRRHTTATVSCSVHLVWNASANTDLESLSRYMVYVNERNVANKTDEVNKSTNSYAMLLNCAPYNVSLRAVNHCGRMSNSTPSITVVPENYLYSEFTGDVSPTTDSGGRSTTGGSPSTKSQISSIDAKCIIFGALFGVATFISIILFIIIVGLLVFKYIYKKPKPGTPNGVHFNSHKESVETK